MPKYLCTLATFTAFVSFSPLFGTLLLDDVMSKSVQEQTGVADLSPNQKKALEVWINDTFVLKNQSEQTPEPSHLYLSINLNNGQQLQLSDGSIWDVNPNNIPIASTWITPFPIVISQSPNPAYPILLTNKNTGASIQVRKSTNPSTNQPAPPPVVAPTK